MNEELLMSSTTNWSSSDDQFGSEEELVRELLDDVSPFFLVRDESSTESNKHTNNSIDNEEGGHNNLNYSKLNTTAYSGPTIEDIENALSVTAEKIQPQQLYSSQARISILEKGMSKIENKYTLKIKSCGNGMTDDGYKWRKYGQKSIKNSINPRSYYRCTNPRCSAKKQVERSNDDPDTLIITYEGLHLHFTDPFYVLGQAQEAHKSAKKPKKSPSEPESRENPKAEDTRNDFVGLNQESAHEERSSQGLLQDVVPPKILNPSSKTSSYSSCSSHRSPPASPSSLLWPSNYYTSCFEF